MLINICNEFIYHEIFNDVNELFNNEYIYNDVNELFVMDIFITMLMNYL